MSKQKPTFEITVATDENRKILYCQENGGPWYGHDFQHLPEPLLHLLDALSNNQRVKINLAEIVQKKEA